MTEATNDGFGFQSPEDKPASTEPSIIHPAPLVTNPEPSCEQSKQLRTERYSWWARELSQRLTAYMQKPSPERHRVLIHQIDQYKEAFTSGSVYVPKLSGHLDV